MARFDIYPDPGGQGYLLDVQADLLSHLNTRLVVPLLPEGQAPKPAQRLNPVFEIDGARVVMVTQFMATVPASILTGKTGSVSAQSADITAAIDMLTQGY